ncbi:MAG: NUDIX hydrolase [Negativicutes bacterium]|nr:NUDIX hydrolase [Negativicutes bacterium]
MLDGFNNEGREAMKKQRFNFCPKCGSRLAYQSLDGRDRLVCGACSYILYENPVVGVAAIVMDGKQLLLGRRAGNSTYPGLWCIPCGYVEYDEDVYEAVKRECEEETGLKIEPVSVFTVLSNFHNPETHTVGIWFWTRIVGGGLKPGDDIDRVGFFDLDDIPSLAFPTDGEVIRQIKASLATR